MSKTIVYVEDGQLYPASILMRVEVRGIRESPFVQELLAKERAMDTMYEDLRQLCEDQARKIKMQEIVLSLSQIALTLVADEIEQRIYDEGPEDWDDDYDEWEDDDGA